MKKLKRILAAALCLAVMLCVFSVSTAAAPLPYLIKVNKLANCVTVYTLDDNGEYTVPVRAMTCSTGNSTPLGTYNLIMRFEWLHLFGDCYGMYAIQIIGNYLFHSVPYDLPSPDTLQAEEYNRLGETASMGCIRLTVEDVKWLYDNCSNGTTVIIYEDEDPGPLGKPETQTIPETATWDPTDPNIYNPWHGDGPTINIEGNLCISRDSGADLFTGVTATDCTGKNLIYQVTCSGSDKLSPGVHRFTYTVTDGAGRTATAQRTVIIASGYTAAE